MTRCDHGVPLDLDCGDCHEEELAKQKLEDLGFAVVDGSSWEFYGYAIEPRLDGWGVNEIRRTPGTFDRHVIVWSPRFDTIDECLIWLDAHKLAGSR